MQNDERWQPTAAAENRAGHDNEHQHGARGWIQAAARIKQLPAESPLVGEEWISGPWAVLSYVTSLDATLGRLEHGQDLLAGFYTRTTASGQLAIEVLPRSIYDRLLLNGFHAEVWLRPGVTEAAARSAPGLGQRSPEQPPSAVLR